MQLLSALVICLTLAPVSRSQIINHHIPKIQPGKVEQLKWPKLNIVAHIATKNGTLKRVPIYQDPGSVRRNMEQKKFYSININPSARPMIGEGYLKQPIGNVHRVTTPNFPPNIFLERKYFNSDQLKYSPKNVDHVETYTLKLSELQKIANKTEEKNPKIFFSQHGPPPQNQTPFFWGRKLDINTTIPKNTEIKLAPKVTSFEYVKNMVKLKKIQNGPQKIDLNNDLSEKNQKSYFKDKIFELTNEKIPRKENYDIKIVKQDQNGNYFFESIKDTKKQNQNIILVTSINNNLNYNTTKDKMILLEINKANQTNINSDFKSKIEPLIITSIYRQFLQDLYSNTTNNKTLRFSFKLSPNDKAQTNNNDPHEYLNNRIQNQ